MKRARRRFLIAEKLEMRRLLHGLPAVEPQWAPPVLQLRLAGDVEVLIDASADNLQVTWQTAPEQPQNEWIAPAEARDVQRVELLGGSGQQSVTIQTDRLQSLDSLYADLGDGDDHLWIRDTAVGDADTILQVAAQLGAGDDVARIEAPATLDVVLGSGNDRLDAVQLRPGRSVEDGIADDAAHQSIVAGGSGDDRIALAGNGPHQVVGGSGDDTLSVSGNNAAYFVIGDELAGAARIRQTENGAVVFILEETASREQGNDRIHLTGEATALVIGGGGSDEVTSDSSRAIAFLGNWRAAAETEIDLGSHHSVHPGTAMELAEKLATFATDDGTDNSYGGIGESNRAIVIGSEGNDVMTAGPGHEILFGNSGDDTLSAQSADVVLIGGRGDDHLTTVVPTALLLDDLWHNYDAPTDVNEDRRQSTLDLAILANAILRDGLGPLPTPPQAIPQRGRMIDTNNNGRLEMLDLLAVLQSLLESSSSQTPFLFPSNSTVPFTYSPGNTRSWPVFSQPLGTADYSLTLHHAAELLGSGTEVDADGVVVSITDDGQLQVAVSDPQESRVFEATLALTHPIAFAHSQTVELRPAPPHRSEITYVSDWVDDLLRIFYDRRKHRFTEITPDGFHQHFRRLQNHGIDRLVVWQGPFPVHAAQQSTTPELWESYVRHARAILEDDAFVSGLEQVPKLTAWKWLSKLLEIRLNPEIGRMYADSAAAHGISLTFSFRPFDAALSRYYSVPVFRSDGTFLRNFQPQAAPELTFLPQDHGYRNIRGILGEAAGTEFGQVAEVRIANVSRLPEVMLRYRSGYRDFRITASRHPAIDPNSYVLVENEDKYTLASFDTIGEAARSKYHVVSDYTLDDSEGILRIGGLQSVAEDYPYLHIEPNSAFAGLLEFDSDIQLDIRSAGGGPLNRAAWYWQSDQDSTKVAGILPDGDVRPEFVAVGNKISVEVNDQRRRQPFQRGLTVNLGTPWSSEFLDFTRAASRDLAARQIAASLEHTAFDGVLLNTRSHAKLVGTVADGSLGLQSILHYRKAGTNYDPLGLERAYAPQSTIQGLVDSAQYLPSLGDWLQREWTSSCLNENCDSTWRYERNAAIAGGIDALILELEGQFPESKIQYVLPPNASVQERLIARLGELSDAPETLYRQTENYVNHSWVASEAMSLLPTSYALAEPVHVGISAFPSQAPLEIYLDEISFSDGKHPLLFEAQRTLRTASDEAQRRREEIIVEILQRPEFSQVILYESADWLYDLPLIDPHAYLDDHLLLDDELSA